MVNFVLVAGAWLGARAWDDVVPELRAGGHGVLPVTLSGLAERSGVPAGQQTHVQDVVDVVERRDLRDVVLVGHSYSGYRSVRPPSGSATGCGAWSSSTRTCRRTASRSCPRGPTAGRPGGGGGIDSRDRGFWAPPTEADCTGQGLSDEQTGRLIAGSTPHPGATLTEPAVLERTVGELPATYVKCLLDGDAPSPDVAELLRGGLWRLVELDTGHWPMFSRPRELARVLLDAAVL
ncbi:alpha/beta hydrolase [Streptomyces sp. I6]|uniref:alpha/beta hydrolase n=1 Tax=Streptomyces sp. I6 TaxID=2483113 RepID=UPI0011CEB724|nr:alpha/beta hydrolase [Streptomyces sp. I6]